MRKPLFLLLFLALAGCASGEDAPPLSGTWSAVVGGDSLSLTVNEEDERVAGIALWGQDQYTVDGTHTHPEVALSLTGPFTATRVITLRGTFSDEETIWATLSTPGFVDQQATFHAAP